MQKQGGLILIEIAAIRVPTFIFQNECDAIILKNFFRNKAIIESNV